MTFGDHLYYKWLGDVFLRFHLACLKCSMNSSCRVRITMTVRFHIAALENREEHVLLVA